MTRSLAAAVLAVVAVGATWLGSPPRAIIAVAPGADVGAIAARAPRDAVLVLSPGRYDGFELRRPVAVRGEPGAVVEGEIRVLADRVRLADLVIVGGENGVTVRDVEGVRIQRVTVRTAGFHGIEVIGASAAITDCRVRGLRSRYAQGIEVRMADERPPTFIRGCVVEGGQEGIVSHVAFVRVLDNHVSRTTIRAISITEMSEGIAAGNTIRDATGVGLSCGDMSRCEFRDNDVRRVRRDPAGVKSLAGFGVVAWYYSTMRVEGNVVAETDGRAIELRQGSRLVRASPLTTVRPGARALVPLVLASFIALLALLGASVVARFFPLSRARRPASWAPPFVAAGIAVQAFHMLEHTVQVAQVHVFDATQRSGILGSAVDAEWLHFGYNALVLSFLILVAMVGGPVRPSALLGALGVQAYHLAEHTAKIAQHLASGINPAPGIFGDEVGLVTFHFAINLAVFAGLVLAFLPRGGLLPRSARMRAIARRA